MGPPRARSIAGALCVMVLPVACANLASFDETNDAKHASSSGGTSSASPSNPTNSSSSSGSTSTSSSSSTSSSGDASSDATDATPPPPPPPPCTKTPNDGSCTTGDTCCSGHCNFDKQCKDNCKDLDFCGRNEDCCVRRYCAGVCVQCIPGGSKPAYAFGVARSDSCCSMRLINTNPVTCASE